MTRLFDGEVDVAYMQFYVETPAVIPQDVERRFAGQTNGLCGAGEAGMLQCTTGLHTGPVPVTVDLLDTAPDEIDGGTAHGAADGWEEVVEVSLTTTTPHVLLYDWDHQHPIELPLGIGTFRVRYHATGMEAGSAADTHGTGEPLLDRYLLQFWPADPAPEPAPDAVLRQTSELAAYWHDTARNTPVPDARPAPTHDSSPSAGRDDGLARFHAFIDEVTTAGPERQRAAARWLAHHAAETAGPDTAAWLRPALTALDQGQPLPAPFDDHPSSLAAVHRDLAHLEGARDTTGPQGRPNAPGTSVSAVVTVCLAANPDPWQAVMSALNTANIDGRPSAELHAELSARFLS